MRHSSASNAIDKTIADNRVELFIIKIKQEIDLNLLVLFGHCCALNSY